MNETLTFVKAATAVHIALSDRGCTAIKVVFELKVKQTVPVENLKTPLIFFLDSLKFNEK